MVYISIQLRGYMTIEWSTGPNRGFTKGADYYRKNTIFGTEKRWKRGFGSVLFQKLSVPKCLSRVGGIPPEAEARAVQSKKKKSACRSSNSHAFQNPNFTVAAVKQEKTLPVDRQNCRTTSLGRRNQYLGTTCPKNFNGVALGRWNVKYGIWRDRSARIRGGCYKALQITSIITA
jgi:hypothetical protein